MRGHALRLVALDRWWSKAAAGIEPGRGERADALLQALALALPGQARELLDNDMGVTSNSQVQ